MDKFEQLKKSLKKTVDAFKELKECGINEEVLIAYIQYQTKLSRREILGVLESYEDFHTNLIKKEMLKKFEADENNDKK